MEEFCGFYGYLEERGYSGFVGGGTFHCLAQWADLLPVTLKTLMNVHPFPHHQSYSNTKENDTDHNFRVS